MNTRKLITSVAFICFLVLMMFVVTAPAFAEAGVYARVGIIIEVDESEDIITIEDAVGFIWQYEGVEDFAIGDIVGMVMLDIEGTESILDDVILSVEYSGYVAAELK